MLPRSKTNKKQLIINLRITKDGYKIENFDEELRPPELKKELRKEEPKSTQQKLIEPKKWTNNYIQQNHTIPHTVRILYQNITIPICSSWFCLQKVHPIEKNSLPEFFNKPYNNFYEKSEFLYMFYRNSIIGLWRENMKKNLTAAICRKNIPGDVCAIMRVHTFLQIWGLINFPNKEAKGKKLNEYIYYCHYCGEQENIFYINSKLKKPFQICEYCFYKDNIPLIFNKEDFLMVNIEEQKKKESEWTRSESRRLLQLISKQKERDKQGNINWNNIFREFPDKNKQKLIMNFLKIPLQNPSFTHIFQNGEDNQEAVMSKNPTIFEDVENPIQIAVAILNKLVDESEGKNQKYREIMQAAQKHSKYMAVMEKNKLIGISRSLIDLIVSKIGEKLIYLEEIERVMFKQKQILKVKKLQQQLDNMFNRMENDQFNRNKQLQ